MEVIQKRSVVDSSFKDGGYYKTGPGTKAKLVEEDFDMGTEESSSLRSVASRLEQSLRAAKTAHLSCGEVLLPPDLLMRVARDIVRMAETEPCGLRGALILLNFDPSSSNNKVNGTGTRREIHSSNSSLNSTSSNGSNSSSSTNGGSGGGGTESSRNIGRIRCDSQTVTTFELHLTLREDPTPWYSRLPQILRNWTKGGTIVVSPAYTIAKKKLYRSH